MKAISSDKQSIILELTRNDLDCLFAAAILAAEKIEEDRDFAALDISEEEIDVLLDGVIEATQKIRWS